ncbi:MAG: alpha/beta hydrolase [Chloroherpetonaceae bacterium]|nr:alpha/beta hydrolase [Chloroherpetonaceae bacterium]MCS7212557.1 alpha/beta hydrolase [Chloroherpetonaceae bacterium]MDW8018702.1 alpha/beta hydrolase [Chloroherpetonaceae bacterium]
MSILSTARCDLYYEDSASHDPHHRQKPTILFINGWALSGRYWQPTIEALADACRTVTFDQSGTGRTRFRQHRPSFTIEGFADEASALIEHLRLGVDAPLHIVGHSMGSMVAAELFHRYASRAASLTIIACGIFEYSAADLRFQMQMLATFLRATMSAKRLFKYAPLRHAFIAKAASRPIPTEYANIILEDFLTVDDDAATAVGTFSLRHDISLRYTEHLLTANAPMCLIVGDKDRTIPPAGMITLFEKRQLHTSAPTTFVRFPSLGHLPMLEDTPAFAGVLRQYVLQSETAAHCYDTHASRFQNA